MRPYRERILLFGQSTPRMAHLLMYAKETGHTKEGSVVFNPRREVYEFGAIRSVQAFVSVSECWGGGSDWLKSRS